MAPSSIVEPQRQLLLMACSASKRGGFRPAIDLYDGVMYQTYRKHVNPRARPRLVILSAEHGFISPNEGIVTYERKFDTQRADEFIATLPHLVGRLLWPRGLQSVVLCGGTEYRRVMRAALDHLVARGILPAGAPTLAFSGGIGEQRQQLGEFLRDLHDPLPIVGWQENGEVALYSRMGRWEVGERICVPAWKGSPTGTIESLFHGPMGPTACVQIDKAPRIRAHPAWVGLEALATPLVGETNSTHPLLTQELAGEEIARRSC